MLRPAAAVGVKPPRVSAAPLPRSLADLVTLIPRPSSPLSTAPRLFSPLVYVCWCALSSLGLSLSVSFWLCQYRSFSFRVCLSTLVYHSLLSSSVPLLCLCSALPIGVHWLMCYYRQTQLTGIPYLPTRALTSSPNSLSLPLASSCSLSLSAHSVPSHCWAGNQCSSCSQTAAPPLHSPRLY